MSLKEALNASPTRRRKRCPLVVAISGLDDEDIEAVHMAVAKIREMWATDQKGKSGYTANWLWRTLIDNEVSISKDQVRDHVKGECACERP